MRLRAKIRPGFLREIIAGRKRHELRQIEGITLVNSETGEEHSFEISEIVKVTSEYAKAEFKYLGLPFREGLLNAIIILGDEIEDGK